MNPDRVGGRAFFYSSAGSNLHGFSRDEDAAPGRRRAVQETRGARTQMDCSRFEGLLFAGGDLALAENGGSGEVTAAAAAAAAGRSEDISHA